MLRSRTGNRKAMATAKGVLLGVLLAWVFPAWLTMRPSSGLTAAQRLSAVNDARTALAALLVAIGVPREREDDPPEDVYAGIRVTARLLAVSNARLNLRDADLRNVDLSNTPMGQLMLEGADLRGATLPFDRQVT